MLQVRDEGVLDVQHLYIDTTKPDLVGRMEGVPYTRTRDKFEPSAALGQSLLAKHME
ncbi:hypothetical protein [Bradyrhizobium sp. AS23.2]|uniref:hypothetical protein n=1 Tax=Bradyrhizobium sp. AS23.2 TaxID=1680155 RepID=UPI001AD8422A|nr:hypothetical protein [Bradyrhizobium sp. AS23.2]